jgi:hypothetical protein
MEETLTAIISVEYHTAQTVFVAGAIATTISKPVY